MVRITMGVRFIYDDIWKAVGNAWQDEIWRRTAPSDYYHNRYHERVEYFAKAHNFKFIYKDTDIGKQVTHVEFSSEEDAMWFLLKWS